VRSVPALLWPTVAAAPDRRALVLDDRSTTYGEFGDLVERSARALGALGVGPGDRVATVLPNGIEQIAVLFATTTIGAVVVPLNARASAAERHPLAVAKQVATASDLTAGRVALGIGTGWLGEEFAALDAPFSTRGARTDEMLTIMTRLRRDGHLAFDGRHFRFDSVVQTPSPRHRIPVHVGGRSAPALRRAARHDGWLGPRLGVDELAPIVERVRTIRREVRPDDTFSVFAVPVEPRRADDYVALDGVTDLVIALWGFDDGGIGPALSERIDALEEFARSADLPRWP